MTILSITILDTDRKIDLALTDRPIRIGRHQDNEIVIPDSRVSRTHLIVERSGDGFRLQDPSSHNGTVLNDRELERGVWQPLAPGDRVDIAMGAAHLALREETPTPVAPAEADEHRTVGLTVFCPVDQIIPEIQLPQTGAIPKKPTDTALELERLSRHIEKQAERLALLSELNKALGSVAHLETPVIYDRSAELLFNSTPADRCLILLRDPSSGELRPVYTRSRPNTAIEEVPVSRTMMARALKERRSVLWSHEASAGDTPETLLKHGIHSMMCAPLLGRQKDLGILYVDRQSPTDVFEVDDLELLNTVAGPTAIAIDNALAFEQIHRDELARAAYGRFLPQHLVEKLIAQPESIQLGGVTQTVTILFADIRSFSTMAERAQPEKVVLLLNDYFTAMATLIFENGGTLDKFLGDGMMVLFGAPVAAGDDAMRAVRTAVRMQERMMTLGDELMRHGFPRIEIGIGINTGEVTVGYIGSDRRLDYTAIGDAVNSTARLESQAGPGQILLAGATAARIGDIFQLHDLGELQVKGKETRIKTFEVLWDGKRRETRTTRGPAPEKEGAAGETLHEKRRGKKGGGRSRGDS